jgi:hypothetical protein
MRFLSDFNYGNKYMQKIGLSFREQVKRLSIDETALSNSQLTILTTKAAKGRKGTIVATITGTKAQTVVAIIEKHSLNDEVTVSE